MLAKEIAAKQLPIDEGTRTKAYRDTVGKLTIGVGRNLDDRGLRPSEIALMLDNDIDEAIAIARKLVASYDKLSEERKAVLINMAFNLGETRLAGFVNTIKYINEGNYKQAAANMRMSVWYKQVGARAERLAKIMEAN